MKHPCSMEALIRQSPVIAILRNLPVHATLPYAQAAVKGGVTAFEVALNSKHAFEQIRILRDALGDIATVGAGTCINTALCERAVEAGAQFMLSPSTNAEVLRYASKNQIPLLPGVMTPTDVETCVNAGFYTLKLFPAGDLPKGYIKSLQGPFSDTAYVAVGGVSRETVASFFEQGYVGVGVGSNLIPKEVIEQERWEDAVAMVHTFVSAARNAGGNQK